MSEDNGHRDTDQDELRERDTLPPPDLSAQIDELQAFLGEFQRGLGVRLAALHQSLGHHGLAITTLEAKVNPLVGLPARVKHIERLIGLADG
jgi:hypothetical protein